MTDPARDPTRARSVKSYAARRAFRDAILRPPEVAGVEGAIDPHNMEQALRWGSQLVMLRAGRIALDLGAAEKQGLGVGDLVERLHRRIGERFAEDRALLVEPP